MSNYKGYLLKINNTKIEGKYISNYKTTPDRRTDLDSYVNADGKLIRKILTHKRSGVVFTTSLLLLEDKIRLQNIIGNRDTVNLDYWNDETNQYQKGVFYVPDVEFDIKDFNKDTIIYNPVTFEFIEY